MQNKRRYTQLAGILTVSALLGGLIISCGGKGSDSGPQSVTYVSASQAANGGSSAKASVDMTKAINDALSGLSSSTSNPAGYAPGKGGAATPDTSSIANIDPKLKTLVDGMLAALKAPVVRKAVSKVRASRAKIHMTAGPGTAGTVTLSGVCGGGSGTFTISGTDTSSSTFVEYSVDIRFDSCRDVPDVAGLYSITTGTIHVYEKEMTGNVANTRNATLDLVVEKYDPSSVHMKTDRAQCTFDGADSGTSISRSGRNAASGTFSEQDWGRNEKGTFSFTNMVNDWQWAWDPASSTETVSNTTNGDFGLFFEPNFGQSLRLAIGLSNLTNTVRNNNDASRDQWVNGSVAISWTPDLSIFGCKSGRITFTTADAAPLHFAAPDATCPLSGTLQVNNATIVYYGANDPTHIVVTVGMDSVSLSDCSAMRGGICN